MPLTYTTVPPSPAGRRLASELRQLRERTGMTGESVAGRLQWSPSKLSRVERARTSARPADVARLLRLYRVPDTFTGTLLKLAEQAWAERGREDGERSAVTEVLAWAPVTVPMLLRTGGYYATELSTVQRVTPLSPGMVRAAVNRNALWQDRVTGEDPVRVRAVLDESVLLRQRGSRAVMRDQVTLLLELGGMEHVELKVLLLNGPRSNSAPSHLPAFTYTRLASGADGLPAAGEVSVPALTDPWMAGNEQDTWLYYLAFEQLSGAAEPAEDCLRLAEQSWS